MSLKVIPKDIGGVSISSITSPLASLLAPTGVKNLTYPSDLGSNPSMGHAVVIQAYDYTTSLNDSFRNTSIDSVGAGFKKGLTQIGGSIGSGFTGFFTGDSTVAGTIEGVAKGLNDIPGISTLKAASYSPMRKGNPLATVSLFMPDTVTASYDSSYSEISMTQELGIAGVLGNAMTDLAKPGLKNVTTPYAVDLGSRAIGAIGASKIKTGQDLGAALSQAAGVVSNPQMQLLYRGISLRTFQLEFILTPKSPQEAKTVKDICDSFAFYSLPGKAGAQYGLSGQYLTPPQIFSVQFKFLGENGIISNVSSVISSALTNSGLGFLTTGVRDISNAAPAKLFTINDCVLENVNVDYAPNGWAAYNDGYPVQTRLTLQFKEMEMLTKEIFSGTKVYNNYTPTPGSVQDFSTGPNLSTPNVNAEDY